MISLKEIVGKHNFKDLSEDVQSNLFCLHQKMNFLRRAYKSSMTVTSGFRSMEEHLYIYQKKKLDNPQINIPLGSLHLIGAAIDILDSRQELRQWISLNLDMVESLGLYMEDFESTKTWVHFQIYPPSSGNRFFKP